MERWEVRYEYESMSRKGVHDGVEMKLLGHDTIGCLFGTTFGFVRDGLGLRLVSGAVRMKYVS